MLTTCITFYKGLEVEDFYYIFLFVELFHFLFLYFLNSLEQGF